MSRSNRELLIFSAVGIGILILLFLLIWGNYTYCRQNSGGNDFLVHWMGTRKLVFEEVSPYSDETAQAIQQFAYGHVAQEGEHQLRVAYPLYSIIIFFPFALISDFTMARALWMVLLEISLVCSTFLAIRMVNWKPHRVLFTFLVLFSLLWYHGLRPIINGNIVVIIALLFICTFWAIKKGIDELAGILLALSTIKPQLAILPVVFIMVWAMMQRRWKLVVWFVVSMALLIAGAILVIPDWMIQNLREVINYPGYNPPGTFGTALSAFMPGIGKAAGWIMTGVLSLILLIEWMISKRGGFRNFYWTASLTLLASQWIGIQTDPGNFIILLPGLIMIFAALENRWMRNGTAVTIALMTLLFIGLWMLFAMTVQVVNSQPVQSPLMFFPLPAIMFAGLYWVRWWMIRSPVSSLADDMIE